MDRKRWGIVLIVVGFALLIGGYLTYLLTHYSPIVLLPFGMILALAGGEMWRRASRTMCGR